MNHFIWVIWACKYSLIASQKKKQFKQFDIILHFRWPFNWKTPIGFLVAFTVEFVADISTQLWFNPTLCLFIGLCWLTVAFVRDIASDLNFLNVGGTSCHCRAKFIEQFCKIVELFADARQLSFIPTRSGSSAIIFYFYFFSIIDEFNRIFAFIPTGLILFSLSSMCIPLMELQMELVEYAIHVVYFWINQHFPFSTYWKNSRSQLWAYMEWWAQ